MGCVRNYIASNTCKTVIYMIMTTNKVQKVKFIDCRLYVWRQQSQYSMQDHEPHPRGSLAESDPLVRQTTPEVTFARAREGLVPWCNCMPGFFCFNLPRLDLLDRESKRSTCNYASLLINQWLKEDWAQALLIVQLTHRVIQSLH